MLWAVAALGLAAAQAADVDNGERLAKAGNCQACHTGEDGAPWAGGHAIETKFGTFYGTNLTPDATGLASWSFEDFERAMTRGKDPSGRPYYPAFPFPSFTKMTRSDLEDLWAYLQSLEPVRQRNREHQVARKYRGRFLLSMWRLLAFEAGEYQPDEQQSEQWNRGAYLVNGPAHCGECHTPRTGIGKVDTAHAFEGNPDPPKPAPDITQAKLAEWTLDDWTTLLQMGMLPDGDFVGAGMGEVVSEGTAWLTAEDREAMAVYLMSVEGSSSSD